MQPSEIVKRKFIDSLKVNGYKVRTDTGWSDIKYIHKTVEYDVWELKTKSYKIRCADTHIVFNSLNDNVLNEVFIKDLQIGDYIHTDNGSEEVLSVNKLDNSINMFDLELDDDNHRFYSNGILSHNSATTRGFILWYALFNPDKVVAILANKLSLAQEQLQQLRDSYMQLPIWMQPGVYQWNKRAIQFANNTRVMCAATSPDGIRGMSIDVLYLDEFAFIKSHIADDFIASVFPTIASGKKTKVIITSTPNGLNHFYYIWKESVDAIDNSSGDKYIKSEIPWNAVPGRDEKWAQAEKDRIGEIRFNQEYKCISYIELVTILYKITGNIKQISIGELYDKQITSIKNNIEILTPSGFKSFHGVAKYPPQIGITLYFNDETKFNCAKNHKLRINNQFIEAKDCLYKFMDNDYKQVIKIVENDIAECYYDILEVETHEYISSGIISHNCDFIGSTSTLIDHNILKKLSPKKPLELDGLPAYIRIWDLPKPIAQVNSNNWEYVASLDSGYGVYKDNTVLNICLVISNITIHQVAVMSSNSLEIVAFCKIARQLLKKYHDPSLIIEQNGPGIAATKYFYHTAEYENLVHFNTTGKQMGLWASEKTKQNAVILFKTYIQRRFLKVYDEVTITEMASYGQVTQSKWGATGGNHDDHITSIYWIPYYVNSPFFYGNIVDISIRKPNDNTEIVDDNDYEIEDEVILSLSDKNSTMQELNDNAKYLSYQEHFNKEEEEQEESEYNAHMIIKR